jgi:hypothetical protein
MRPPRYMFPNEVRDTTRAAAARMVRDGDIARTPEDLDAWIAREPEARASLENGGYGREFTAHDLFPLLQVMVTQAGGPAPEPDAPPRSSRPPWLVGLVVVVLVLVLAGRRAASGVSMRLITTFLLLAACGCSAPAPAEGDAAAVYEAFLSIDFTTASERVLLQDVATPVTASFLNEGVDPSRPEMMRLLPEVQQAVDDLIARGRSPGPLPPEVLVSAKQARISADSAAALFRSVRGHAIRRLADSAVVVQLSGVGFSRDRSVAVVYRNVVCGYLCGGGMVRVVRRYPDGWLPAEVLFAVLY